MASFTFAQLDPNAGTGNGTPYAGATPRLLERTVDFSKTRPDGTALALAQNETGDVLRIPAKCVVLTAGFEVIKPESDAQTISLGDPAAATQYGSSLSAAAAAGTILTSAGAAKGYGAASALRVTATGATVLNTATLRFFAVVVDLQ